MAHPDSYRCFDEGHVFGCTSTADGRAVCDRCGYEEIERDGDELGGPDCHDCGVCEWCIERSIEAAEGYADAHPGDCEECHGTGRIFCEMRGGFYPCRDCKATGFRGRD